MTGSSTFLGMPHAPRGVGALRGEQPFPVAAKAALANTQLRRNLGHATSTIRAKRANVVAELDDWEALRLAGSLERSRLLRLCASRAMVDWLHVVVNVCLVLVFGRQVLMRVVPVRHRGMIVLVCVGGAEVLESADMHVPVVCYVVVPVSVRHGFVGVLLPFGLRVWHRLTPLDGLLSESDRFGDLVNFDQRRPIGWRTRTPTGER